jgi:hypothetical protein
MSAFSTPVAMGRIPAMRLIPGVAIAGSLAASG